MILEALFLTALVMSSFYMCEAITQAEVSTSQRAQGFRFHETADEWEEMPPELGPEEDPRNETIFTITLSSKEDDEKVALEDGPWSGRWSLDVGNEDVGQEEESFVDKREKGPMRLQFRWRENPLFNETV